MQVLLLGMGLKENSFTTYMWPNLIYSTTSHYIPLCFCHVSYVVNHNLNSGVVNVLSPRSLVVAVLDPLFKQNNE